MINHLVILNTMFIHKDIHKYIRVEPKKGERSVIDYIIVQRGMRKFIKDVRVKRGTEHGSDHKLWIVEMMQKIETINIKEGRNEM